MSLVENRLRNDAAAISASVPDDVSRRMRAALTREARPGLAFMPGLPVMPLRFASVAVAVVAVVGAVLWLGPPGQSPDSAIVRAPSMAAYEGTVAKFSGVMDGQISDERELQRELELITTDLRRIRSGVNSELESLL